MDSEKMLLDLYKKHQYESTRYKIQGVVMLMSAVGMFIGVILTAILISQPISLYLFIGVVTCIAVAFLLQYFKMISRNSASLVYFVFICLLFTPINWYVTDGLQGSTPFISVIVMLAAMMVFTGKTLKVIGISYLGIVFVLMTYSIISAPDVSQVPELIYKSAAFSIVIVLSFYYMVVMLNKYDQMHNRFLSGSIKDELTRVFTRGTLDVVIHYVESLYKTKKTDYLMIMIDVDNFKKLNDKYGHVVGDIVLRNTARCIKENMREDDFVIRYGGDEFLVILINTTLEGAQSLLDRIEENQQCKHMLDFHITVSRGYARRSECKSPDDVIILADKRMYENKSTKQ